jgi:hypothetical protein
MLHLFVGMHEVVEKRARERDSTRHADADTGGEGREVRRREDSERFLAVCVGKSTHGPSNTGSTSFVDHKVPSAAARLVGARLSAVAAANGGVALGKGNRNVPFKMQPKCIDARHLQLGRG